MNYLTETFLELAKSPDGKFISFQDKVVEDIKKSMLEDGFHKE